MTHSSHQLAQSDHAPEKTYSLDASTIDLCLSVFPWAEFRTTKGAIKLHVGLNHRGHIPEFVTVTDGKVGDVTVGRSIDFPKGSIVAIDRGYNDYTWYKQLTDKGIFFVTRLKSNAKIRVLKSRSVLKSKGLLCDETIEFTGMYTAKKCPIALRRIGYRDPNMDCAVYVFVAGLYQIPIETKQKHAANITSITTQPV